MIDLAEVALLANREGEVFPAVVTDVTESGARIQLGNMPVVARTRLEDVLPGATIRVKLLAADPMQRRLEFERVA